MSLDIQSTTSALWAWLLLETLVPAAIIGGFAGWVAMQRDTFRSRPRKLPLYVGWP
eukprot:gene2203-9149_t